MESQENQINIPNFRPFEVGLLLRYIYHPRVDVKAACDEYPFQTFLEMCVRLWQLGDYYGIETLATSALEQLQNRTERYIADAGHVGDMLESVPFAGELEGAIRVAWDPEKAPGPHRRLLLCLCQALGPYLGAYPGILALFDEIPELASEFSKAVLGCMGTFPRDPHSVADCQNCGEEISTGDADLKGTAIIHRPIVSLMAPNEFLENWYCGDTDCAKEAHATVKHDNCQICKDWGLED